MRLLWSLPKAAPALLRHLIAYVELAGLDLERAQLHFKARLVASLLLGVCLFFALLMGCVLIIALTWDTAHRVAAVAWTGGGFLLVGAIAALYRANVIGAHAPFLGTVRREWQEDRVILERILSSHKD